MVIQGDIVQPDPEDPAKSTVTIKVTGITGVGAEEEDETTLTLNLQTGGLWTSERFIFVTDTIDDATYSGKGDEDGELDDQTILAGFGAEISASFVLKGCTEETTVAIGQIAPPRKTVPCEVIVLEGNQASTPDQLQRAQAHFDAARLLYRQIGFDLDQQGDVSVLSLPAGYADYIAQPIIDPSIDYSVRVDWQAANPSGQIFGDYISGLASTSVVRVFYCPVNLTDLGEIIGHGENLVGWGVAGTPLIGGSCIIELNINALIAGYVTAHELGHVLFAPHPSEDGLFPRMLMDTPLPLPTGTYLDSRRFLKADETFFSRSSYPQ